MDATSKLHAFHLSFTIQRINQMNMDDKMEPATYNHLFKLFQLNFGISASDHDPDSEISLQISPTWPTSEFQSPGDVGVDG